MRAKLILCRALAYAGAAYVAGCCGALIFFIVSRGLPVLGPKLFFGDTPALDAILGLRPVWDGIWPALAGTLCLVVLTTLMAALPGICFGLYLARFAKGRVKERLSLGVDLLASVPSIVMGLFGFVLILALRRTFAPEATTCIFLAAFCMALLVMPSLVVSRCSSCPRSSSARVPRSRACRPRSISPARRSASRRGRYSAGCSSPPLRAESWAASCSRWGAPRRTRRS